MPRKLKAYKFRLYPTASQEVLINKTFGCVRFFWNHQVAAFKAYDKDTNPTPYTNSTRIKLEYPWLREVSAAAIQQKENDFIQYRKQFISKSRKSQLGFPQFKKKSNSQSYRLTNQAFQIITETNQIKLQKIGLVKLVAHKEIDSTAKIISATVSSTASGQFFVSILVEQEIYHITKTNTDVGLDVGIKTFCTQSDNIEIQNPKLFSKSHAKLARLQQHLARKHRGSNRYNTCRLQIAKLHQKISNQRNAFLHNYSKSLVTNYDKIYIEDLDVKSMLESKMQSKQISDVGWSKFFIMLNYKADWYGKDVIRINRFYASSKTCTCGVKNESLLLSDRIWSCSSCGTTHKRDKLAANNILNEGRRSSGEVTDVDVIKQNRQENNLYKSKFKTTTTYIN